jgi:predicted anti-sigma-YlaC factor YlaD
MLTCKGATQLISDGLDRKLPWWRRMGLRVHVMMCAACRAYRRQVIAIDALVRDRYGPDPSIEPIQSLSDERRERIKAALRDQAS